VLNQEANERCMSVVGREHQLWFKLVSAPRHSVISHRCSPCKRRQVRHTNVSPLSLVRFAGKPAGSACWKRARSPSRAALNIRPAKATASAGRAVAGPGSGVLVSMLSGVWWRVRERVHWDTLGAESLIRGNDRVAGLPWVLTKHHHIRVFCVARRQSA